MLDIDWRALGELAPVRDAVIVGDTVKLFTVGWAEMVRVSVPDTDDDMVADGERDATADLLIVGFDDRVLLTDDDDDCVGDWRIVFVVHTLDVIVDDKALSLDARDEAV
jgi:hypothetical protein